MSAEPWDGKEPIIDVLERWRLRDQFQLAVDQGKRERATAFLYEIGVDEADAEAMADVLIPETQDI